MGEQETTATFKKPASGPGTAVSTRPPEKPRSILFICTGNVCRGPLAAALFKRRNSNGIGRIVRSAGVQTTDGRPVLPVAQEAAHRRGIDLSNHLARMVTPNLLPGFDLILAMEARHVQWIESNVPTARDRAYLLGHWRNLEIARPVNGHGPDYERITDEIEQCLADWSRRLQTGRVTQEGGAVRIDSSVASGTP